MLPPPLIFLLIDALLATILGSGGAAPAEIQQPCKADRLTVYRVELHTFWSREKFPKQYPEWRPNAQFSKLVGRSHNQSYVLWRIGSEATDGVRVFAESGKTDSLDTEAQGNGGIYDEFLAPPIPQGVGKTEAEFFVDGNHSRVSLMSRIVPSPDWFIGIDSFDLCVQGKWVDAVTLEVDPTDAGTDQGFTFTAPKWQSDPQEKMYRLTALHPSHPANSFYYPNLKKLPPIATFTFVKVKEYELSQVFYHDAVGISPQRYEYDEEATNVLHQSPSTSSNSHKRTQHSTTTSTRSPVLVPYGVEDEPGIRMVKGQRTTSSSSARTADSAGNRHSSNRDLVNSIRDSYANGGGAKAKVGSMNHHKNIKDRRAPRNCRVSDWSDWSSCSKSCGIGEQRRTRTVLKHSRRGGKPCPNLVETKWCGSARCSTSGRRYFDW